MLENNMRYIFSKINNIFHFLKKYCYIYCELAQDTSIIKQAKICYHITVSFKQITVIKIN